MLQILPHSKCVDVCWGKRVVLLSDEESRNVKLIQSRAKHCLYIECGDLVEPEDGYARPPNFDDMVKLKEFTNATHSDDILNGDIIFSCYGGVSRSSACAYVTLARKIGAARAIQFLDKDKHFPNQLIIGLATIVYQDPLIAAFGSRFLMNAQHQYTLSNFK